MPTLDWIGKQAVVNHHREVPTRLLHCDSALSAGDPETGNLLVEGDNLEALKALLPYYAGQIKCIYIDPPYNTGKEGWVYNDNVNSPEIRAWLGSVVGKEAEDLSRHDKWLCMIYPRLRLLKDFLRSDGIIFVSIDDNEISSMIRVMDEIFGAANSIGRIIWKNVTDNNPTRISVEHEYVVCYAKDISDVNAHWKATTLPIKEKLESLSDELTIEFPNLEERQHAYTAWFRENKAYMWPFDRYKMIDDGGIYTGSQSVHNPGKEGYRYDVTHPVTGLPCQEPLMGYRFPESTMKRLLSDGKIIFGKDETKIVELKLYVQEYKTKLPSIIEMDTRLGSNELRAIFSDRAKIFDFPKPSAFVSEILSFVTSGDDIILDTFAGSGTTGHAVYSLNQMDGGRRKFILCEMDPTIAGTITGERLKRVGDGFGTQAGLGGGFRYCFLGKPLFDEWGTVTAGVTYADLAAFVFFSETGSPIPAKADGATTLLGNFGDRAVHLLWNAECAGVASDKARNVLTPETLTKLPRVSAACSGPVVVYAEGCTVTPERLAAVGVTFKQIPYQVIGA